MSARKPENDWSAAQYLKFADQRTRPVHDLITQLTPHISTTTPRICDLGCGPGNSTAALISRFPGAVVNGVDTSPDMLSRARSSLPNIDFEAGSVESYLPPKGADLLFSNAVLHWLRSGPRLKTLVRLFEDLKQGGVLAIQVPDNYYAPSHALMRATASLPDRSWSAAFVHTNIGNIGDSTRPDLDPIEPPAEFYNALSPFASVVDVWRTEYMHVLPNAKGIVDWVKGTGLLPYLNMIEDGEAKKEFLIEYEMGLKGAYLELQDGKVLLGYPRLFVVAVRK